VKVKYKYRNGGEIGELELDHKPAGAFELRELLGIDNICEELEYLRVYENNKLIYSYPCPKRKKEESELDMLAKDLLRDFLREAVNELKAKRSLSPKDVLAQIIAEYQISRDLYKALNEIFSSSSSSSGFISDLAEFFKLMRELQAQSTLASMAQATPQLTQQNVQAIQQSIADTATGVAQILNQLMQMSPEEREKVLNEALTQLSKQFPQLREYLSNFRSEAGSKSSE
jgi:hypothetical protein